MSEKLWGGRFDVSTDEVMERFSESISFDKKLYREDIEGSVAHTMALEKMGIVTEDEAEKIIAGLRRIKQQIENGEFEFTVSDEDIHMNIEKKLIEMVGKPGAKLHTARSRNDQVVLDVRLFLMKRLVGIIRKLEELLIKLVELAELNINVIMPGFTHMQHAQPVLFSHYVLAYYEAFKRDRERFKDAMKRVDIMPLGSGALAGVSFPYDRMMVAERLGFSKVSKNSMDAVSDRDFIVEFLSCASIFSMHVSRFAEDMVIFSSEEFSFVELPVEFCTGSSIMPQKKNPDALELLRGKSAGVFGSLIASLSLMKGLPMAYNRDMQEDKKFLFEAVETVEVSLEVMNRIVPSIRPRSDNMERWLERGFLTATDVADYLVRKGIPFREAHRIVGSIVSYCEENCKRMNDLSVDEFRTFSGVIGEDVYDVINYRRAIELKNVGGGTSKMRVMERIKEIRDKELNFDVPGDSILCPRCSYPVKVYRNPTPTVDVIIEISGKIVLVRRRNEPIGWAIPGGYIDYGESAEEAAVREAKEETSLDVELTGLLGVYSDPGRDPRSHTITTVFTARAKGVPRAGDDARDVGIFDRNSLPDNIVFDHKKILEEYFRLKGNV